ncbi:MAG: hypothetical protein GPJ51_00145 [Candidatus Heimdallarchaeota archaeon]|nr:hypothetical protein [Candidatus Heimdallarchaeota archaeon]
MGKKLIAYVNFGTTSHHGLWSRYKGIGNPPYIQSIKGKEQAIRKHSLSVNGVGGYVIYPLEQVRAGIRSSFSSYNDFYKSTLN